MTRNNQCDDPGKSRQRKTMHATPAVITVAMLSVIVLAGCLHEERGQNEGLADPYSLFLTEDELPAGLMQCDISGGGLNPLSLNEMESNPGVHPYGVEQPEDRNATEYAHIVAPGPVCDEADYYVYVTIEQVGNPEVFALNREFQIENTPPCEISETDDWMATKRFFEMVGDDRDQVSVKVWERAESDPDDTFEEWEENYKAAEAHRMEVFTALNEKHPHWWLLCRS